MKIAYSAALEINDFFFLRLQKNAPGEEIAEIEAYFEAKYKLLV